MLQSYSEDERKAEQLELLYDKAVSMLSFTPVEDQRQLLRNLVEFVLLSDSRDVFVLNGYAGTGKTSVVGALIKGMDTMKLRVVVLAPTGRGAKVASSMSDHPASTIHRRLFRPDLADPAGRRYVLSPNQSTDTLFIVDEASLISDVGGKANSSLLELLVRYVYSAPGCKMILMGDQAQLPPVGQQEATAMNLDRLRSLGLNPRYYSLDLPMRQRAGSGIIFNATAMREFLNNPDIPDLPKIYSAGYSDVKVISSLLLPDELTESYSSVGIDQTLIITRSNWRANQFNREIRARVFDYESPICRGDRIVISKNDYYWGKINKQGSLIANGDMAEVLWTGGTEKVCGRYFTEVELRLTDGRLITAQLMLKSLVAEGASLPAQDMERYFNIMLSESEGELSERISEVLDSPYYNGLQAKYAYCVTCHKAQGGEWKHVYIDMGGIDTSALGPEFYRWIYTAITRATERVILINPTIPFDE